MNIENYLQSSPRVIAELVVFIRFQFSTHGRQLYKIIALESSLNLII